MLLQPFHPATERFDNAPARTWLIQANAVQAFVLATRSAAADDYANPVAASERASGSAFCSPILIRCQIFEFDALAAMQA